MKKLVLSLVLMLSVLHQTFALELQIPSQAQVIKHLDDTSVTIHTPTGQGSGVIITRNGINYILSAAHVIADCRKKGILETEKDSEPFIYFENISVVKEIYANNVLVGYEEYLVDVLKYSEADMGEDLTIMKLRKKNVFSVSAVFYMENTPPPMGTPIFHMGSMLGQDGANSLTTGIISKVGRVPKEIHNYFDQTSAPGTFGSSGCGMYLLDGRYIGMLTRGSSPVQNLIVPIRRIREWVKKIDMEWLLDPTKVAPLE